VTENRPKSVLYAASILAVVLFVFGLYYFKVVISTPRSETEIIAELLQTTEAPSVITEGERSFPDDMYDRYLETALSDVAKGLQGAMIACSERWTNAPRATRVRLTTDRAGRLLTFAMEGAPERARSCYATVLSQGLFPRFSEGIANFSISGH
jgi:hypothetical protein